MRQMKICNRPLAGTLRAVSSLGHAQPGTATTPMINNRWLNRCAVLAVMFMLYGVGVSAGRDQAAVAHHNHPVCHPNLKP